MPPRCQSISGSLFTVRSLFRAAQSTPRTFTTSSPLRDQDLDDEFDDEVIENDPLRRPKGGDLGSHLPKHILGNTDQIPPYPYGPALLYKQSNSGLYGGQMIQFGNNVSPDTETKTRRNWKPNVLNKNIYSIALKKKIRLRVTAGVLKIIDREGGLDEYLLKESETRIKELGPMGWALRWRIMQTPDIIARFRADAEARGLSQSTIDSYWPSVEILKERAAAVEQMQKEQSVREGLSADSDEEDRLAWRAAKRYLKRGIVNDLEDGLKLAFLRSERRLDSRVRQSSFLEKVNKIGGLQEYVKKQREELEQAGDLATANPEKAAFKAELAAKVEAQGGKEAIMAAAREKALKEIEEAELNGDETAQTALKRARRVMDIRSGVLRVDSVKEELKDSWGSLARSNRQEETQT